MEATGTEIAMKSDQERLEKIRKKIDRRNWRLLTENVVRKNERKKKDNGQGIHDKLHFVIIFSI